MKLLTKNYVAQKIERLVSSAVRHIPDNPYWGDEDNYVSENFYCGNDFFINPKSAAVRGCKWSLGFAKSSLIPDDIFKKPYYLAGFMLGGKYAVQNYPEGNCVEEILDDMAVRVICLDDGSGRGASVFASIDAIGISNADIRKIRANLRDFAEKNNIASINVFSTHCHSSVDTQGLWSSSFGEFGRKVRENLSGKNPDFIQGFADKDFGEILISRVSAAIASAFGEMKPGTLLYNETDIREKISDKRPAERGLKVGDEPSVLTNLSRFTFVPDDSAAKQTIIVNMSAHPCTVGLETYCEDKSAVNYGACLSTGKQLSGDYVASLDKEITDAGFNFMFFNGAIMGTYISGGNVQHDESFAPERYLRAAAFGHEIAELVLSMDISDASELSPCLNIRLSEILADVTNPLVTALGKMGVTSNQIIKNGNGYKTVTEVGYMEIGEKKILLAPGELCPDLVTGRYSVTEKHSVSGLAFPLPSFSQAAGFSKGESMLVFGLANDATGYILPGTDYALIRYHELLCFGKDFAASLVRAFMGIVGNTKRVDL